MGFFNGQLTLDPPELPRHSGIKGCPSSAAFRRMPESLHQGQHPEPSLLAPGVDDRDVRRAVSQAADDFRERPALAKVLGRTPELPDTAGACLAHFTTRSARSMRHRWLQHLEKALCTHLPRQPMVFSRHARHGNECLTHGLGQVLNHAPVAVERGWDGGIGPECAAKWRAEEGKEGSWIMFQDNDAVGLHRRMPEGG
jgi:hypothetical protein